MKKRIAVVIIAIFPLLVHAQNGNEPLIDKEMFHMVLTALVVGLILWSVLVLIKQIMNYRLKNKIMEKSISEEIASSLFQSDKKESKKAAIKWFCILMGIGAGLTIVHYTLPLGVHSLAIIAFCMAASFLAYFFFLNKE